MGQRLTVSHAASEGSDGVWLLEILVAGAPERFATRPASVTSGAETLTFRGGLGDFRISPAASPDRLGIEVDDLQTDWAAIVARGISIDWSPARVWWWYPGQTLEQAVPAMSGIATEVEYGDPVSSTRMTFTLDQRATENPHEYPDEAAAVTETTWPGDNGHSHEEFFGVVDYDDAIDGESYPTVIGYPGSGDTDVTVDSPTAPAGIGVPALCVQSDGRWDTLRILVCEGTCAATQITVWDLAPDRLFLVLHENLTVSQEVDDLGRTVSVATVPITTSLSPSWGGEWYSGWNNAAGWGGGIKDESGVVLRGLGDVLVWALGNTGKRVDLEKQRGQAGQLNRFKIDTFLNNRGDLERWIETQLVPLFPIRRMRSADGIWYRYVNWEATADDAVARLDADTGQVRPVSPVRMVRGDLYNVIPIEYQYKPSSGRFGRRRVLAPEHQPPTPFGGSPDTSVFGSPVCAVSAATYGLRERPTVEAPITWSDSTVMDILRFLAARDALPLHATTYEGRGLDRIIPGDAVVINDTDRGLYDRVALVEDVTVGGPTQTIDLTLLPPPPRQNS